MTAPAKPTIVAATYPSLGAIGLDITTATGSTYLTAYRSVGGETAKPIRFLYDRPCQVGLNIAYDYEAPLNVPITYTATTRNNAGEVSATSDPVIVTLVTVDTWLRVAGFPEASLKVGIESLPELKREVRYSANYVIGRSSPVTISDVRQMATGVLTIATLTKTDADAMRYMLAFGQVMVLQAQEFEGGVRYFLPTTTSEQRVSAIAQHVERRWVMDIIVTDAPATVGQDYVPGGRSYQKVKDSYATYTALRAANDEYADLLRPVTGLLGYRVGDEWVLTPDVPPPSNRLREAFGGG